MCVNARKQLAVKYLGAVSKSTLRRCRFQRLACEPLVVIFGNSVDSVAFGHSLCDCFLRLDWSLATERLSFIDSTIGFPNNSHPDSKVVPCPIGRLRSPSFDITTNQNNTGCRFGMPQKAISRLLRRSDWSRNHGVNASTANWPGSLICVGAKTI